MFETHTADLYNFGDGNFLPEATSKPDLAPKRHRWTIFASALLLLALSLVVIYTSRAAFRSPLAMVVVAAVGLAALLLQIRIRNLGGKVRAPLWLNVLGVGCAVVAVFGDVVHIGPGWMLIVALGAVICFAISGIIVLDALRKQQK